MRAIANISVFCCRNIEQKHLNFDHNGTSVTKGTGVVLISGWSEENDEVKEIRAPIQYKDDILPV